MSSQHDEAHARPDESGVPAASQPGWSPADPGTGQGVGDLPSFGPGPDRQRASAPSFGQFGQFGQTLPVGATTSRPWKVAADGRTVFRRGTPFVVWWAWVAFAIYNVAQIAIPDHDYFSLELTAGLLAVTGLLYACTLRPRVLTDKDGVLVHNPYQDHRIRWGALEGVYLGDSVEFSCVRPAPKKLKTVYCWALYSGRRSRMKSQMRGDRAGLVGFGGARRMPAEAQQVTRQDFVQLMAAEIGRQCTEAKERGAPAAVLESTWAWLPMVYVLVPAALLLGLILGK